MQELQTFEDVFTPFVCYLSISASHTDGRPRREKDNREEGADGQRAS